jgi:hypothetical protein
MLNTPGMAGKTRRLIAVIFICAFAFSSLSAQGVKKKVRFAKGKSSITIRERMRSFKSILPESRSLCRAPATAMM